MLENYKFKYQARGKFIYVPNERCARRGERLIQFFDKLEFPEYFYHYKSGGHVAALHSHLTQNYFFKIDLKNFFYSIAREKSSAHCDTGAFVPAEITHDGPA